MSIAGDGNLVIQQDTVFVSGMDPSFTEDDIADHFGSIGIVKVGAQPSHFHAFCELHSVLGY